QAPSTKEMTNDEIQMTKEVQMTNVQRYWRFHATPARESPFWDWIIRASLFFRLPVGIRHSLEPGHSGLVIHSSFVIRHLSLRRSAFTLIELVISVSLMTLILV